MFRASLSFGLALCGLLSLDPALVGLSFLHRGHGFPVDRGHVGLGGFGGGVVGLGSLFLLLFLLVLVLLLIVVVRVLAVVLGLLLEETLLGLALPVGLGLHELHEEHVAAHCGDCDCADDDECDGPAGEAVGLLGLDEELEGDVELVVVVAGAQFGVLGGADAGAGLDDEAVVDAEFADAGVAGVEGEEADALDGVGGVAGEGEVEVEGHSALAEVEAAQDVLDLDVGALQVGGRHRLLPARGGVEGPALAGVVDREHHLAVPVEDLEHGGEALGDGEVAVEGLDVVLVLVEAVAVEDLDDFVADDGAGLVDVEVDLEGVEVAGRHDHLRLPVVEDGVVVLLVDGDRRVEGRVGQRVVDPQHLLLQVDELDLQHLHRLPPLHPLEVHHEEPVPQLGDHQPVGLRQVREREVGVADEAGTADPVVGRDQVVGVDELDLVEDFGLEGVVVHGVDDHAALAVETPGPLVHVHDDEQVFHDVHAGHVLGRRGVGPIDEGLAGSVDGGVEVDLVALLAGGETVLVHPAVLDGDAALAVEDGGEGDELVDGAVVVHLDDALELLDEAALGTEGVVLHVEGAEDSAFLLDVVDDSDLVVAVGAVGEGEVEDGAVQPGRVVEHVVLVVVVVVQRVGQVVRVDLGVIQHDVLGVVRDLHARAGEIVVALLRVVGVGQVERVVREGVLEYQDRDFVLPEHFQDGTDSHCHVVSEVASGVDQDVVVLRVEVVDVVERSHSGKTSAVDHDDAALAFRQLGVGTRDVDQVAQVGEVQVELVGDDVAEGGEQLGSRDVLESVEFFQVVLLDGVGRVHEDEFSPGDAHLPLVEAHLLGGGGLDFSQFGDASAGDVDDDHSIDALDEQDVGVEVGGVDLDGGEVVDARSVHGGGVDAVHLDALFILVVPALDHVEEHDFLHVPQHNHQVLAQELDRLDLALVAFGEHDGSGAEFCPVFDVEDEDLVGELVEEDGGEVDELALVVVEAVGGEVGDAEVDVGSEAAFPAVDLVAVGDGGAHAEVGHVVEVLRVEVEVRLVDGVELLLPQEHVLRNGGVSVPEEAGGVLLQDVADGGVAVLVVDAVGDVGAEDVAVQRHEQLSGVVGVVGIGQLEAGGPEGERVHGHDQKLVGEGADETLVGVLVGGLAPDHEAELLVEEVGAGGVDGEDGGGDLVDGHAVGVDGQHLRVVAREVHEGVEVGVRDGGVGVEVGAGAAVEDVGGGRGEGSALGVGQVGSQLHHHVLLVDPEVVDPGGLGDAVLGDDLGFDLVGPVDLEDGVVVGEDEEELVVEVVAVDAELGEAGVSAVAAVDHDGLGGGDVELDDSAEVVQDVDVSQVDFEVGDRQLVLVQEGSVHHSDRPGLHWVVHRHDLNIGVLTVVFIDVFGEVGPDEIVVVVLSQQLDLPVPDDVEGHIHIVPHLGDGLGGGRVDVVEVVDQAEGSRGGAVHQRHHLRSEPHRVVAVGLAVVLHSHVVLQVGDDGGVGGRGAPPEHRVVAVSAEGHQRVAPVVAVVVEVVVAQTGLLAGEVLQLEDLLADADEAGLGGDGQVEVVPAEDVVHVVGLRLVEGDREVQQVDFGGVAGGHGRLAGRGDHRQEEGESQQQPKCGSGQIFHHINDKKRNPAPQIPFHFNFSITPRNARRARAGTSSPRCTGGCRSRRGSC